MRERPSYLTQEEIKQIATQRAKINKALRQHRVEDIGRFFTALLLELFL